MNDKTATGDAFRRDGVVHLNGFFDSAEMQKLEEALRRYVDDIVPTVPPKDAFFERSDDPRTLKQLQRMEEHDPFFADLQTSEKLVQLAELLLGQPVRSAGVEWFNKPARVGGPTPPHQDGFYFCFVPDEAVTVWIALEDVDEQNGCLRYERGSHRHGTRPHGQSEVLGFSQTILDFSDADRENEFVGAAQRGDVLAHQSATIHWADANRSNRSRRSLAVVYQSERARRDEAAFERYWQSSSRQQQSLGVKL